jgi:hypothetical protein
LEVYRYFFISSTYLITELYFSIHFTRSSYPDNHLVRAKCLRPNYNKNRPPGILRISKWGLLEFCTFPGDLYSQKMEILTPKTLGTQINVTPTTHFLFVLFLGSVLPPYLTLSVRQVSGGCPAGI